MIKKSMKAPISGTVLILDKWVKMIKNVQNAVESIPFDMVKFESILYEINKPDFKYPEPTKCCKNCTADKSGIQMKKALDIIKTMSVDDPIEDILEKTDLMGLVFSMNEYSIKGKLFKKVKNNE